MRSMGEGHPPVGAISWSYPVETLRQHSPPTGGRGGPLSPCGRGLRRLTSARVSRSWVRGGAPSVAHNAAFVRMETLRQYNLARSREDTKKGLARPVILKTPTVILNLFHLR